MIIKIIISIIEATAISLVLCKIWSIITNHIFKEFDDKRDNDDTL